MGICLKIRSKLQDAFLQNYKMLQSLKDIPNRQFFVLILMQILTHVMKRGSQNRLSNLCQMDARQHHRLTMSLLPHLAHFVAPF